MTEPYDLRSNIKDKPGSQGTLFQVKDKGLLNPQQRWPRGYTPERRDEIAGALRDTPVVSKLAHAEPINPPQVHEDGDMRFARYPQAEHRVVDTLARSTVPAEDLKGITRIHDQPAFGTLATYWPAKREMAVPMIGTRVERSTGRTFQEQGEHSLIHELGHHVDATQTRETNQVMAQGVAAKVDYAGQGRDKVRAGIGEGVADNYYVEHYRGRGRKGERATEGLYEASWEPKALHRKYPGYTEVRPAKGFRNLSGAQFQGTLF